MRYQRAYNSCTCRREKLPSCNQSVPGWLGWAMGEFRRKFNFSCAYSSCTSYRSQLLKTDVSRTVRVVGVVRTFGHSSSCNFRQASDEHHQHENRTTNSQHHDDHDTQYSPPPTLYLHYVLSRALVLDARLPQQEDARTTSASPMTLLVRRLVVREYFSFSVFLVRSRVVFLVDGLPKKVRIVRAAYIRVPGLRSREETTTTTTTNRADGSIDRSHETESGLLWGRT